MRTIVRLLIVLSLTLATSLQAITYIVPSDRDLVKRAEAIVIATAVESHSELRDDQRLVTVATLSVERVLKGSVGESIQLVELGGVVGSRETFIPGSPRYEDGKRYLVFLRTNYLGEWMTYGFGLGKFAFISDLRGRELLTRGETSEKIFGLDESDGSLHFEKLRGGPEFLSFVQSRIRSEAPARETYFVDPSDVVFATFPEFRPQASRFVPLPLSTFAADYLLAGNYRWQGPSCSFLYCCGTQTGGTGLDGPSASSGGMAAWNSISGAGINYTLTGPEANQSQVPNGLFGAPDGKNDIIFNDRHGIIGGSGAIAVGGISNNNPSPYSLPGDPNSYLATTEVDVETGNNLPSFVNQNLFTQFLTHELGHTLGFRHADGTSNRLSPQNGDGGCHTPSPCAAVGVAIMASTLPINNSIGSLGQWDTCAALIVYGNGGTPPNISGQPANTSITSGQQTTLSVTANGSSLTYQWYIGTSGVTTTPISGAINSSVIVSPTVTTTYWVQVTSCSSTNSNAATVTVTQPACVPPSASVPIASPASIPNGQTSTLSVTPSGTSPFTYQWFIGNSGVTTSPIGGATSSFVVVSPSVTTTYWVRVTGQCAPPADSREVTVTVTCSPIASGGVTAQPSTISAGQSSTLFFATSGTGPFTIQWYTGGLGDTSNPIPGATGTSTVVSPSGTTGYWVHVTAPCGSQDGSVIVFVAGAPCIAPSITTQPANSSISAGSPVTLTVAASGTAPLTFQWYTGDKGDITHPIAGATTASLTQSPAATTKYWARVSNSCNGTQSADSNAATITITGPVCTAPSITTQPANVSAPIGTSATLKVIAAGTAPLHYQWFQGVKGDTSKPVGTDSATFVSGAIDVNTAFWVHVTGQCGSPADSNAAIVTATAAPRGRAVRH